MDQREDSYKGKKLNWHLSLLVVFIFLGAAWTVWPFNMNEKDEELIREYILLNEEAGELRSEMFLNGKELQTLRKNDPCRYEQELHEFMEDWDQLSTYNSKMNIIFGDLSEGGKRFLRFQVFKNAEGEK